MQYALRKFWALAIVAFALIAASLVPMPGPAGARENQTMLEGVTACKRACDRMNRTVESQHRCYVQCERYWLCNGRDSTASTCAERSVLPSDDTSNPTPTPRHSEAAPRTSTVGVPPKP